MPTALRGVSEASASDLAPRPSSVSTRAWHVRAGSLMRTMRGVDAATWFLILALPIGLYLAIAIFPGQGLDEPNHFYRVLQLSQGTLLAEHADGKVGGAVSSCAVAYLTR